MTNANTYSGGTIINNFSGNVQISNVAALGTGTVQLNATNNVGNTAQSALQLNFAVPATGAGSSAANPNVITNTITGNEQNLLTSGPANFAHLENVAGFNRLTGSLHHHRDGRHFAERRRRRGQQPGTGRNPDDERRDRDRQLERL